MRKHSRAAAVAITGLGLAACGRADDRSDADLLMEDTITQTDTQMVEIPVPTTDTAVVRTEVEIDTTVEVDTIENIDGM